MADLKTKSTSAQGREVILTKGAGTAIEDGDGEPFIGAIVNDLTTGGVTAPLSAEQGVELEAIKLALAGGTMTGLLRATAGLNFNASGGDTLDEYELGTWTPTLLGTTTNPTQSYTVQLGEYMKIGDWVFAECWVRLSTNITAGSGRIALGGLPFTSASDSANTRGGVSIGFSGGFAAGTPQYGFVRGDSTQVEFWLYGATGYTTTNAENYENDNSRIAATIIYKAI